MVKQKTVSPSFTLIVWSKSWHTAAPWDLLITLMSWTSLVHDHFNVSTLKPGLSCRDQFHKLFCALRRTFAPQNSFSKVGRRGRAQMYRAISMTVAMRPTFMKSTSDLKHKKLIYYNWPILRNSCKNLCSPLLE